MIEMFKNNNQYQKKHAWKCFLCHTEYPNTLRYCPSCNIAKKHSDNLYKTALKKEKEREKRKKNKLKKLKHI